MEQRSVERIRAAKHVITVFAGLFLAACSSEATTMVVPGADALVLAWPFGGTDGADWVINNYVDLDGGSGLRDYRSGGKSYNGHQGIDIDVPNFRWMDADFPVLASAAGVVTAMHDGELDRNVSCVGTWNFVDVTHPGGSRAVYGHLKRNSIIVSVGQTVSPGQVIGVVGSSGCSTQPHLHFEVRAETGAIIDPFLDGLWVDPPAYDVPLTYMDTSLKNGALADVSELKDPSPNITSLSLGSTLGVGLSMAGGGVGDVVRVTLQGGDGSLEHEMSVTFDRVWRHTYWFWNRSITRNPGTWTVTVYANGSPVAAHDITVS